ncbi:hypothetical protein GCM10009837_55330 [Streptomyces durmitorensis]|uniref:ATP-binding protein n=1 Tax=Streptomyces durmitorensis TaxID=319947 RepID=A0ABY4PT86_9ACTN|nr:ATP-binding protein [Streptomyces durmitorensis]UQT56196.1 ATP-binding protein [Streptomyces durmitorensis]
MSNTEATPTLPTHHWSMDYPMTPASARLARLQTRRRLTAWQWGGDIDDAVLVVSELTANAARHGRAAGRHLWLRLALVEDGQLIVDVSDPIAAFPGFGQVGPVSDADECGRGLAVVREVALELEWFLRPDKGKVVRARLAALDG